MHEAMFVSVITAGNAIILSGTREGLELRDILDVV